ncbi:hypothetical protein SLS64_012159 [Diaporthe eres]|uniref:Uncharacterized protein n=1 Tax=Diaporthe eres TaxID=83184 RepID=A0ABR1PGJ3_DIAER
MSTCQEFLQGRLVAAWSDESTWDDFMDKRSVVEYLVETTIMDAWDDLTEYCVNPWYHPVASFKQVMKPLLRFFWEIFGKSPVFWFIVAAWTIRWAHSNYNLYHAAVWVIRWAYSNCKFYYTCLVEAINTQSNWCRNTSLVFWNRKAPAPADHAPSTDNAPSADNSPPAEKPLNDENAPALAENAPTPNRAALARAAERTLLWLENTDIPNGDARAATERA